MNCPLFLSEKQSNGHAGKIKILTQLIFQIVPVGQLHVVGKIAEKSK